MEPITVLLANLDIFVAYWFFILKGKPFSPQGWHTDIFSRKKYKYLVNSGIDVHKYCEYIEIRDALKNRLSLLTRSPSRFL